MLKVHASHDIPTIIIIVIITIIMVSSSCGVSISISIIISSSSSNSSSISIISISSSSESTSSSSVGPSLVLISLASLGGLVATTGPAAETGVGTRRRRSAGSRAVWGRTVRSPFLVE